MLEIEVRELEKWSQKSKGLMGQIPYPVFFKTRWGIHTFFMKASIDVVILDSKGYIATLKPALKPWRVLVWNPRYEQVLELPKGTIEKMKLKKGSRVQLIFI